MKHFLIPEEGSFYKANLHCHSTFSDGALTPEEIKEKYMARGYSIVAYTDHNGMFPHPELCDDKFLALSGWEYDVTEETEAPWPERKTCHFCFVALHDDPKMVCYDENHVREELRPLVPVEEKECGFRREYTPECISHMMQKGRDAGFFVTYNHPVWSMEDYENYTKYHGMHAMEICNYGCVWAGWPDYVPQIYDDMLRGGERIFAVATDDNHNLTSEDNWDSFGGFTVIKARDLTLPSVAKALLAGEFYASQGPAIHALYIEDGKLHVKTSPAVKVELNTGVRYARTVWSTGEDGAEAVFDLRPDLRYFRVTVTDKEGKCANSNAYFLDTLKESL